MVYLTIYSYRFRYAIAVKRNVQFEISNIFECIIFLNVFEKCKARVPQRGVKCTTDADAGVVKSLLHII